MSTNVLIFGWNRSVAGREMMSAKHFQEFSEYLGALQRNGTIQSAEPILLQPHGGQLNGFFLIKGEPEKLAALTASDEWLGHQIRGVVHMEGSAIVRGVAGPAVMKHMDIWTKALPH